MPEQHLPSQEPDAYWLGASAPGGIVANAVPGREMGKWIATVYTRNVDAAWAKIKVATEAGVLGPASKVSTARENPNATSRATQVIIVYTADVEDAEDIGRVLAQLRALGFDSRLNYKSDADTRAGQYGAGSSLYTSDPGSVEFHTPKKRRR